MPRSEGKIKSSGNPYLGSDSPHPPPGHARVQGAGEGEGGACRRPHPDPPGHHRMRGHRPLRRTPEGPCGTNADRDWHNVLGGSATRIYWPFTGAPFFS